MPIRSGRFVGGASASAGIPIISGHEGTYRVFNAGEHPFDIYEGNSLLQEVPVECSADIRPGGLISIRSTNPVDGIYDFLSDRASIRNGRFKVSADFEIVAGAKDGVFYRVMNSGSSAFNVQRRKNANSTLVVTLQPKMTIDVELRNVRLGIVPTVLAEGIYYRLDQGADVRNGRFKLDPRIPATPPTDPSVPHAIIDTTTQSKDESYYRIFNSGEFPFSISGLTSPVTVVPRMSFDFKIEKTNTVIEVAGMNADDPIEGIYEFVGEHD